MKKEIIVNASKDRSRIAIVEDGELVELYVEHPDNIRTLGNIYLARVRKVMPAIRAAFVDIGQKQDAFLHFSDLTDNLGELLAISGEKVPGIESRVLAHAPQKRVADDENEPDVEDTLELEASESASENRTSRSRRSSHSRSRSRSRSRRRNRPRREEEEEQEEANETAGGSPFVIDLTVKTGRDKPTRTERKPDPVPEPRDKADDSNVEGPEPKQSRIDQRDSLSNESEAKPRGPVGQLDLTRAATSAVSSTKPVDVEEIVDEPEAPERGTEDSADRRPRRRGRRGGRHRNRRRKEVSTEDGSLDDHDSNAADSKIDEEKTTVKDARTIDLTSSRIRRPSRSPVEEASGRTDEEEESEPRRERRPARGGRGQQHGRSGRGSERVSRRGHEQSDKSSFQGDRRSTKEPPSFRPEELLKRDQRLIVKLTKEPISSKGSRVSTDISFAGRFLVLIPAADYVAVSKKIESGRERRRLRTLATSLRPEGFGVIVRTVAEGRDARTLETDMRLLVEKWSKIESQLDARPTPPTLLYEDVNMISSIIRDLFTEDFDRILVDDPKLHRNIKAYVGAVAPHMADRVKLHRSNAPLFRTVGIERSVEQVFSSRVPLRSGGYLFIEHTEAMHVVDVNSGRAGKGKTQAENLLSVNLEAAVEVARQLRLRDLGGIIVIDFIDMWRDADRRKVYQTLKREFTKDRAVTKLLPMSDFGLIQITRQRLRPSITTTENGNAGDPAAAMAAAGASEIKQPERDFGPELLDTSVSSDDLVRRLDGWLKNYRATVQERFRSRPIVIRVHPLFAAYLKRGMITQIRRWKWNVKGLSFEVMQDDGMHPLDFDVRDKKSGKSLTSRYEPKSEK